jgi:acetoin:2,6-dichlorophenolindophenol oxidoreductase subunit alpha
MRELLGREGGVCGGKGGSMHITSVAHGYFGSYAIVGAHLPIACGLGWAQRLRGDGAVTVCFFGDGATNIGAFHETLNLAAIWKLPAIFVIENNHYGEYSPLASTTPITRLADRAAGYGMPGEYVDGNDVVAVRAVARTAVRRARAGDGPTLIEADTYRQQGHSRSDPGAYRPDGELEHWLARDPIDRLADAMLAGRRYDASTVDTIRAEVAEATSAALARAMSWPAPDPAARFDNVYAERKGR